MITLTAETSDRVPLGLDDGDIHLTIHGSRVILDLSEAQLSRKKCEEIISRIEALLQEEDPTTVDTSLTEKIAFILKNRGPPFVPSDLEILTRVNDAVVSLSRFSFTGDIRYYSIDNSTTINQELLVKIHQAIVKLVMKRWRDNLTQTSMIIHSIFDTINKLQIISSALGAVSLLSGLVTNTPTYLALSLIPFFSTGVLALIKKLL